MRHRGVARACAGMGVVLFVVIMGCRSGAEKSPPAASAPVDWKSMTPYALPPDDSLAVKEAANLISRKLAQGEYQEAWRLFSPASSAPLSKWLGPGVREVVSVAQAGEPLPTAQDLARVRVPITVRVAAEGPLQGRSQNSSLDLYFVVSDPRHQAHILGADIGPADVPTSSAEQWRELGPEVAPDDPRSTAQQTIRAIIMSILSRQWPGWDEDADKLADGINAWWQAQADQYGPYDPIRSGVPLARFVGAIDAAAVADRDIYFGTGEAGWTKVTYRFLLTHDSSVPEPAGVKAHYAWKIADIAVGKAEKIPPQHSAEPARGDPAAASATSAAPSSPFAR